MHLLHRGARGFDSCVHDWPTRQQLAFHSGTTLASYAARTRDARRRSSIFVLAWLLPPYECLSLWTASPQVGPIVLPLVLLVMLQHARTIAGGNR